MILPNEKIIIEQIISDKKTELTNAETELNKISEMTYADVEVYVDTNVNSLAEAKTFLKLLARINLALIKTIKEKLY